MFILCLSVWLLDLLLPYESFRDVMAAVLVVGFIGLVLFHNKNNEGRLL